MNKVFNPEKNIWSSLLKRPLYSLDSVKDIVDENPDVILVMPCGYDINQTTREIHLLTQKERWNALKAVQNNEVYVLDGNRYFNRPGSTIYESARILAEILHPKLFKPIHHKLGWIRFNEQLQDV